MLMPKNINKNRNFTLSSKSRKKPKLLLNFTSNIKKPRLESANTNFTSKTHQNLISQNKNYDNQSYYSTENYSDQNNISTNMTKPNYIHRPIWKYSYYLDKNDILCLNKINGKSEIKTSLCDFKDIDKRPKPIVYSWTKPRMIKIIENNKIIEEEVKSHFWKYSHIFENKEFKRPGKLLRILMLQLSQGYEGREYFRSSNRIGILGGNGSLQNNLLQKRKWKVGGINRHYEPITIKRPNTAYKY